ncbi:hypothetical protein HanXRQr2_Chr08g0330831 [Helianthus annuus]|uniref:Uncharacterized protein n=1 Tax=Helianthus annuus TaxID=4232 RepID=A0A251U5K8_HELAN|nr:hypothetical protein HanXRQr2_Chr08g0330831 [Helianthus annuus]KAJ0552912.1 hypothetical protein HanHA89_Chr08g0290481 [Helianthus annuus]KAJ0900966.1 hypothetical protein HanPSC8_Chr08g0319801 [Helianthus annuus]
MVCTVASVTCVSYNTSPSPYDLCEQLICGSYTGMYNDVRKHSCSLQVQAFGVYNIKLDPQTIGGGTSCSLQDQTNCYFHNM